MSKLNRKGVTLVELIVAMVLMVIIIGAANLIVSPMLEMFFKVKDQEAMNAAIMTISEAVETEIKQADTGLSFVYSCTSSCTGDNNLSSITINMGYQEVILTINQTNGEITKTLNGVTSPLLDAKYYENRVVKLGFPRENCTFNGTVCETDLEFYPVTLNLYRDGSLTFSREFIIKPPLLRR